MGCRVLASNDYRITCGFPGHQQRTRGKQHIYGCDIVTAAYTTCAITAHSSGTVKRVINYIKGHEVDRQGYGYGNQVIIEHKNGVCTIYCHMEPGSICVSEGQQVEAGDIIGRMGIPYREKGLNIINVVLDAPMDAVSALSGKLGRLPGVTAKAVYSKLPAAETKKGQES